MRNACAGSMTCENCTGHCALSIARSLRAIGSLAATISRNFFPPYFSTGSCRRKEVEVQSYRPKAVWIVYFLRPGPKEERAQRNTEPAFADNSDTLRAADLS